MNPILSREIRTRWRDGRAFLLIFFFAAGLAALFGAVYASNASAPGQVTSSGRWAELGRSLFSLFGWIQTLAWLLVSPTLTSSAIAYERERGWFDSLLLSPLLPRQISMGKWSGALLFAALMYVVTLPCMVLVVLMGGVSPAQFWQMLGLHLLCATAGSAIGLGASGWSYRAHSALRSAHGIIIIWLFASFAGATWAGRTIFSRLVSSWGGSVTPFWEWVGRTNPILSASQISNGSPLQDWPLVYAVLSFMTVFFLWVATYYSRRPLEEAPYVEPRKRRKKDAPPLQSHGEIPLVTKLKFKNPVLDHEVRSKFRMRQPPMAVIVVEALLGLLVAGFYLRTLYWAFFVPKYRITIWAGLTLTGMIVTMMAAAAMGANGFSREREKGTWEGIQLSLLSAGEIIRGKVFSSLWTCFLFSLPVLPLMLPCIEWSANVRPYRVLPMVALWDALIWLSTIWSFTLVGLLIGRKQNRSSRASGQTMGILGAFVILMPIVLYGIFGARVADPIIATVHPMGVLLDTLGRQKPFGFFESGPSFVVFHLVLGAVIWVVLQRGVARELKQEGNDSRL